MLQNTSRYLIVATLIVAVVTIIIAKKSSGKCPLACAVRKAEPVVVMSGDDAVATEKLPRLVDLGAGKCVPCKMMAPIIEELKSEYAGKLDVVFIDVWENPDESKKYGIDIIPTQIFYDASGKELFRHEGFYSKEDILAKYKEFDIVFAIETADKPQTNLETE